MKKNKTIAYLMAATLLVGGTFLGTKALFIDKEDMVGEIKISTGDVDLKVGDGNWVLTRNGRDDNEGSNPAHDEVGEFDNLKTGDVLTKEVTITNAGTLKAIVDLQENKDAIISNEQSLGNSFEYTAEVDGSVVENDHTMYMYPKDTKTIKLKLTVTGGGMHNNKDSKGSINTDAQEASTITLKDSFILNAKQVTNDNDFPQQ